MAHCTSTVGAWGLMAIFENARDELERDRTLPEGAVLPAPSPPPGCTASAGGLTCQ